MLRRVLLLLLCCVLPLQSLQAEAGALSHIRVVGGTVVALDQVQGHHAHVPHHHHVDVAWQLVHEDSSSASVDHMSDHCVCPLGCLLPSASWVVHRVAALQSLPEWTPRPLPAPVLPGPQRPPHLAG